VDYYRGSVFEDIPVCPGFIQDGDTLLVKKTIVQVEEGYQTWTFGTYLRNCPEVDISEMGYPFGEITAFR